MKICRSSSFMNVVRWRLAELWPLDKGNFKQFMVSMDSLNWNLRCKYTMRIPRSRCILPLVTSFSRNSQFLLVSVKPWVYLRYKLCCQKWHSRCSDTNLVWNCDYLMIFVDIFWTYVIFCLLITTINWLQKKTLVLFLQVKMLISWGEEPNGQDMVTMQRMKTVSTLRT